MAGPVQPVWLILTAAASHIPFQSLSPPVERRDGNQLQGTAGQPGACRGTVPGKRRAEPREAQAAALAGVTPQKSRMSWGFLSSRLSWSKVTATKRVGSRQGGAPAHGLGADGINGDGVKEGRSQPSVAQCWGDELMFSPENSGELLLLQPR